VFETLNAFGAYLLTAQYNSVAARWNMDRRIGLVAIKKYHNILPSVAAGVVV
jgi:hypothetical protein